MLVPVRGKEAVTSPWARDRWIGLHVSEKMGRAMRRTDIKAAVLLAAVLAPRMCAGGDPVAVTPKWLAEAKRTMGSKLIVAEASWNPGGGEREYNAGHIPGAIHIDTDVFENGSPRWHLLPPAELHAALSGLGIAPDSVVVVYSHQTVAAARVWWVMEYAGVADVRYLDGGLEAWRRAGFPVESAPNKLAPARFTARVRSRLLAETGGVRRQRGSVVLADVRSESEFRGETSGYSYLEAKGRIPGAIAAGNAADEARLYQHADGTLREAAEIREMWRKAGLPVDGREIVFYCGSGWRSSLAVLYARMMGLRNVRNYSDGWSGWSTRYEQSGGEWKQVPSSNPVTRGQ